MMMAKTKLFVLIFFMIVFSGVMASCQRSRSFREDQKFYRQDSQYSSKRNAAMARAEKFGQPRKKMVILPFYNVTPLGGDELGEFISIELAREIRTSGKAVIPEDLKIADQSRDFYSGDKIRLTPLVREGKKLGVALMVVGKIKKITYRIKGDEVGLFRQKKSIAAVDLEMRIFDVMNGKELLFDEKTADNTSSQLNLFGNDDGDIKSMRIELVKMALHVGAELFAADTVRAIEKISWEGRIAKISGNYIYINAGRATGLNIGDILKVLTSGEDIYDPVTNAYMGRSPGQPKGTLEVVDFMGTDGAVATIHSGGNFLESDVVQLY
jgi:hypothetical protein